MVVAYLKLIRHSNLVMIAIAQCFIKWGFLPYYSIDKSLSLSNFCLLVLATICIAAGGNTINDILDQKADRINKPHKIVIGNQIQPFQARVFYYVITTIGILAGFVLSINIGKSLYSLLFILIVLLLLVYSSAFKKIVLLDNIIVSLIVGFSLYVVGIFETGSIEISSALFIGIGVISLFAFCMNLLRELVKDLQDINGDYIDANQTLPIALGFSRTAKFTTILGLVTSLLIALFTYINLYHHTVAVITLTIGILAPLLYVCMKLWEIKRSSELKKISLILKLIMAIGILSIPLIAQSLNYAR